MLLVEASTGLRAGFDPAGHGLDSGWDDGGNMFPPGSGSLDSCGSHGGVESVSQLFDPARGSSTLSHVA